MILLDGACGTCLFEKANKRGLKEVPPWQYSLIAPDMVEELEKEYIAAGTKIIQTNTFSANPQAVEHMGCNFEEVITAAVKIAKKSCLGTDCRVSLDIGPLTKHLEPYGDMSEDECRSIYRRIISAGVKESAELITLETFMDLNMLRLAADEAALTGLPVLCSMTYQKDGKSLFGNSPKEVCEFANEFASAHKGLEFAIGINCSFGPEAALDVLKSYSENTQVPLLFKPNVDEGVSASEFARLCKPAFEIAEYIGSCCNSSPEFITELKKLQEE